MARLGTGGTFAFSACALAIAAVALVTFVAACSLTTSLDGLTGGLADAAAPDASPSTLDAATSAADVLDDAGGTDGSTVDGAESGPCADTSSDPANCGRCGHDCQGGTCSGGMCVPDVLVSGQNAAFAIALDATYVYFTATGGGVVGRVPLAGGADGGNAPVEYYATGVSQPQGIAVNSTYVYWGAFTGNGISRCALSAAATCLTSPAIYQSTSGPDQLATDGVSVYWSSGLASGDVYRRLPAGLPVAEPIAQALADPAGIAIDGATIYWVERAGGRVAYAPKSATSATPTVLATGKQPYRVAAAGGIVYWTDPGDGTLRSCAEGGCGKSGPVLVAGGLVSPSDLAVSSDKTGTRLVWIDRGVAGGGSGTLWECDVIAGACADGPFALAAGQDAPEAVAIGTGWVYWTRKDGVARTPQ